MTDLVRLDASEKDRRLIAYGKRSWFNTSGKWMVGANIVNVPAFFIDGHEGLPFTAACLAMVGVGIARFVKKQRGANLAMAQWRRSANSKTATEIYNSLSFGLQPTAYPIVMKIYEWDNYHKTGTLSSYESERIRELYTVLTELKAVDDAQKAQAEAETLVDVTADAKSYIEVAKKSLPVVKDTRARKYPRQETRDELITRLQRNLQAQKTKEAADQAIVRAETAKRAEQYREKKLAEIEAKLAHAEAEIKHLAATTPRVTEDYDLTTRTVYTTVDLPDGRKMVVKNRREWADDF